MKRRVVRPGPAAAVAWRVGAAADQGTRQGPRQAGRRRDRPARHGERRPDPAAALDLVLRQQTARGAPDSEQLRAQVREALINNELLIQEANRSGIAKKAEVQQQIDLTRQEVIANAVVAEYIRANPVSDADIQKEYERAKAQTGDREYKARHILVATEDDAKSVLADLKKGGKFEEIAQKRSLDEGTRPKGGDLDWNVVSPCVTFNDHEGSTKSYAYVKDHDDPVEEVSFVPFFEDIAVDYAPGTMQEVTMHDGSKLYLKKLEEEYDPTDKISALKRLHETARRGEFATGLIYIEPDRDDFLTQLDVVDEPLATLPLDRVRPGPEALEEIMEGLR